LALVLIEVFQLSLRSSLVLGFFLSISPLLKFTITLPTWFQQSFTTRHFLIPPSLEIISEHWLTGVGLRQFISSLAGKIPGNQLSYQSLQPVHNTLLLILAELGIIGTLILYKLFSETINPLFENPEAKKYLTKIFGVILITGSLDHYWWTLPQNQLIIVLAIALITNKMSFRPPSSPRCEAGRNLYKLSC
jgi:O-antigen ligase